MNKNINKNILIASIKSYDKMNETKKSPKMNINLDGFLNDYFKDKDTKNLSKYINLE
jgi:hypothetical protein